MKRLGQIVAVVGMLVVGALLRPSVADAQTQCTTNALAGGTGNAITVPLLPCANTTNLLILTLASANTSPAVTLQMPGYAALPVVNSNGSPLTIGELPGANAVVLLSGTGTKWLVLTGSSAGGYGAGITTPFSFGAIGGCTGEDDSAAYQSAINSGLLVYIPPLSCFHVTTLITVPSGVTIFGPGKVFFDTGLGANDGAINVAYNITGSNVFINGGTDYDSAGATFVPATANHYLCFVVGGNTNVHCDGLNINNWSYSDGNIGDSQPNPNLLVSHVMYVVSGSNITFNGNNVNTCSGAAFFGNAATNVQVLNNSILNCIWYPINMYTNVNGAEIAYNTINMTLPGGIFWGGGINLMSQLGATEDQNIDIHDNTLEGYYSYGAVVRVLSCQNCKIHHNHFKNIALGSWGINAQDSTGVPYATGQINAGNGFNLIAVGTRAVGASANVPSNNVVVEDNDGSAPLNVYSIPATAASTTGNTQSGTTALTVTSGTGIVNGQIIVDTAHSNDIPFGGTTNWTYVVSGGGTTSLVLSNQMTGTHTGDTLIFRNAGNSFAIGDQYCLTGGTETANACFNVDSIAGNGAIGSAHVTNPGIYTVLPTNPVSLGTTSGSGTGNPTFTVLWNPQQCLYFTNDGQSSTILARHLSATHNVCTSTGYGQSME